MAAGGSSRRPSGRLFPWRYLHNLRTPPPCEMTWLCCFPVCLCLFYKNKPVFSYSFDLPFPLGRDLHLHLHAPTIHNATYTLFTFYSILTLSYSCLFFLRRVHLSFIFHSFFSSCFCVFSHGFLLSFFFKIFSCYFSFMCPFLYAFILFILCFLSSF